MKAIFTALVCLVPFTANASSLVCQGRELVGGNKGKAGEIVISVEKKTQDENDKRILLTVQWSDADAALVSPTVGCGVEIPAGMDCYGKASLPGNISYNVNQSCGRDEAYMGVPRYTFYSSVVLNGDGSHGRVYCSAAGKNYSNVEVSGCREKN
ncbi:MAG: hypothetical protein AB7K68_12170 [Bacteriovoracia bacterium]